MCDLAGAPPTEQDPLVDFVSVVLADTEDVWHEQFNLMGTTYVEPTLVLFSGAVQSACGFAEAAMGPFYCPPDQKVYIDLDFYHNLKERHNAPGDRWQQQGRGYVTPDCFTHDSSVQRVEWFRRGFSSGNIERCNTFPTADFEQ